jgi:DNA processing protein
MTNVSGPAYGDGMTSAAEDPELVALVALLFVVEPHRRPSEIRRGFELGRSATEQLRFGADATALVGLDDVETVETARDLISGWRAQGITLLSPVIEQYPAQLAEVYDYPVLLFARGSLLNDRRSVAVVGSRNLSPNGEAFTHEFAREIAGNRVTVVSGLARGVDSAAHRAALGVHGRTVAVLGNGLDHVYPAEHAGLQRDIESRGLLVSQFLPGSRPTRSTFPQRNIVMSAYSSLTAIIEAGEKSGTRIQADAAVKHGRPLILTDQVVRGTTWGRKYADGPYNVTVVGTPRGASSAVARILSRRISPAELLA